MMFGFVGIGQAGGNIAEVAAKKGFHSVAVNYSQKDLDSLEKVNDTLKLVGTEGVGKRRDDAVEMIPNNIEMVQKFFENHFTTPTIEVIVVAFAAGGGTGSGVSPLLVEVLSHQMPDKAIVACPILPDLSESPISQFNTVKVSEELSSLDVAVFPIDNSKAESEGKDKLYKEVNEKVVELFSILYEYTNKSSVEGILDRKDLLEIFKTVGVGVIAIQDLAKLEKKNDLTEAGVAEQITDSWDRSVFVTPEMDKVESIGIIFDGQASMMGVVSHKAITSGFGSRPPYVYEGYYHGERGKAITVLTGLSWYNTRLQEIEDLLADNVDNLEQKQTSYTADLKINLGARTKKKEKRSSLDIIKKYQSR
jgi:cell division GTPase FtsZ